MGSGNIRKIGKNWHLGYLNGGGAMQDLMKITQFRVVSTSRGAYGLGLIKNISRVQK